MNDGWRELIRNEFRMPYFIDLMRFVEQDIKTFNVLPPRDEIFRALSYFNPIDTKVVILGQDPYHGLDQANGLAFSVDSGIHIPPSLQNVFKELEQDTGIKRSQHGDLSKWAEQGVLLLNTILTVREDEPNSHRLTGWEVFTNSIISALNELDAPIVFMLWGNQAKDKKHLITNPDHLILEAAHPSPLSCHKGFYGCKHFSKANTFLKEYRFEQIDWSL